MRAGKGPEQELASPESRFLKSSRERSKQVKFKNPREGSMPKRLKKSPLIDSSSKLYQVGPHDGSKLESWSHLKRFFSSPNTPTF